MKISFDKSKFLQAFQIAASVAAKRAVEPILQNVKISADKKNGVILQAADTEFGIRIIVKDCDVFDKGSAVLPTNRIKAILTECPAETLTIESTAAKIQVSGLHSKWTLETRSPADFPDVEKFAKKTYHEIPAKTLKEMIRRTAFAIDWDNAKYALGGVCFEMLDSDIFAIATDGRRMACQVGSGKSVGGHKVESSVVTVKTLQLLERMLPDSEIPVKAAISDNRVLFECGDFVIFSRLVEGRFPKWRNIIPNQESNEPISVMCGVLQSAVKQAKISTSEKKPGVFFIFDKGELEIRGRVRKFPGVELSIAYSGKKQKFELDPKYVLDVLRVLDSETNVEMYPPQGDDPFVIKTEDGYQYLIMPMKQ